MLLLHLKSKRLLISISHIAWLEIKSWLLSKLWLRMIYLWYNLRWFNILWVALKFFEKRYMSCALPNKFEYATSLNMLWNYSRSQHIYWEHIIWEMIKHNLLLSWEEWERKGKQHTWPKEENYFSKQYMTLLYEDGT